MDKLKVIIADDEQDAIEILGNLLVDTGKIEIITRINDPLKIESAVNKWNPDVLFLDIEMPHMSGLAFLENIRNYNQELPVVLVTAYKKYINEAIKLNVFSYLQKPVDRIELNNLIDQLNCLKEQKGRSKIDKIKLPITDGYVYIKPEELYLITAEGNYSHIKTITGEVYVSSYNMGRLYNMIPENGFFRINRNSILNGNFIYKINKKKGTCLTRVGELYEEFEVSKTFLTHFNKSLK